MPTKPTYTFFVHWNKIQCSVYWYTNLKAERDTHSSKDAIDVHLVHVSKVKKDKKNKGNGNKEHKSNAVNVLRWPRASMVWVGGGVIEDTCKIV